MRIERDYRVTPLVIPTPAPERPFDGLRTVPRRRLEVIIVKSRFLGKWGAAFWFWPMGACAWKVG
jgi:hypothetical protein